MRPLAILLAPALAALACSSSVNSSGGPLGADAGKEGGEPLPTDGGAPLDASAKGDGSSAADTRIDPVEVGRSWTYEVTPIGAGYTICPAGRHTAEALREVSVGGRQAIETSGACSGVAATPLIVTGDKVEAYYGGNFATYLEIPVQEGTQWSYFNATYVWKASPAVTVPAGTFTDCWIQHQVVGYTAESVFCRGVGQVKTKLVDLGGNGWDAVLVAKNF